MHWNKKIRTEFRDSDIIQRLFSDIYYREIDVEMRCRDSDIIQRLISDIFYREIMWKCDAEIRT